ncbi:MAG TPA: PIG-L family deacetylase [Atribacterota bacterium]|nr:PIG-L family deacetylase [Atribacterota bacterium]
MVQVISKIIFNKKWQLAVLAIIIVAGILIFRYIRDNPVLPQSAIPFLKDIELPASGEIILIFSPHPDDETIACGGYIAESIKKGAKVYIILVTDGNKHGLRDVRYQEFKKATGSLGVMEENLVFLNYPDGGLASVDPVELQKALAEQIAEYHPHILFYPHPGDMHQDHATVGKITEKIFQELKDKVATKKDLEKYKELVREEVWKELVAIEQIVNKMASYKYLVHHDVFPHPKKYAPDLYVLPPLNLIIAGAGGGWIKFLLSAETESLKDKALKSYVSQLKNPFLTGLLEASIRKNELFAVD